MDVARQLGFQPSSFSPVIGILYAEDFDEVSEPTPSAPEAAATEPAPAPLTQDDVDRACTEAVATARLQWQSESERLRTHLLAEIAASLANARAAAEELAAAAAEGIAKTILALLSGALPHFCNEHGAGEVRAILDRIIPMLRSEPRVIVRVHPDLAPELRREFADLQVGFSGTLTVLPTAAEPSDLTVEWENGSLSRDTGQILQAMQDALGQLGLQQPRETTPKRRMADAE